LPSRPAPLDLLGAESAVLDDLDLWAEATGGRLTGLTKFQRLGLEAWLWGTYDRSGRYDGDADPFAGPLGARNPDRCVPKKSPEHDAPWPGARKWAPRRWFGPCPSGKPLEISPSGAPSISAQLDSEFEAEVAWSEGRTGFPTAAELPSKRKHPNPGGFYGPKRGWWGPETEPGCSLLGGPQPAVYCAEKDESPPESVLEQRHEPPNELKLLRVVVGAFRLGRPPAWVNSFYDLRGQTGGRARWKVGDGKPTGRRYRDQHVIDIVAGVGWPTRVQRRPANAPYTIDLIWRPVRTGPIKISVPRYCVWPVAGGVYFMPAPEAPRALIREVLRSPHFPASGEPLWRPDKDAKGWAAIVPNRRPGAWARRYVEGRADELDAKRKRLEGPGRLLRSVWGEVRGGKLVGTKCKKGWAARGIGDDLDRLAVSAAIEAT
jgi:hypothetical protein